MPISDKGSENAIGLQWQGDSRGVAGSSVTSQGSSPKGTHTEDVTTAARSMETWPWGKRREGPVPDSGLGEHG